MPGICGMVNLKNDLPPPDAASMISAIQYAKSTGVERYSDEGISLGIVHLGSTTNPFFICQSQEIVVLFYGYLTQPVMQPCTDLLNSASAARFLHDCYLEWGDHFLNDIRGAFAVVIWDRRNQTLLLANDHLGLRPLYYSSYRGVFYFSSEVKGILTNANFPHRLNHSAVADFFYFSLIMGEKTFFDDIQLLPPASILRLHDGHWSLSHYWEMKFPETYRPYSSPYYEDLIFESMKSSVKRMVQPGLYYGLSLSGGLDSRWIAALMAHEQSRYTAFTLGTPGSDDTPLAQAVAKQLGVPFQYWEVAPTFCIDLGETYAYLVDGMDILWHMEEFPLAIRVGDFADVSVGGLLGDGLFGYEINPVSMYLKKEDVPVYRLWRTRACRLPKPWMERIFGEKQSREMEQLAIHSLKIHYGEAPCERGFQAIQYYDLRQAERRNANIAQLAKLAYVNTYHPIADDEVIRAALQLPPQQLIMERGYRRSLAKHLPEMAKIPWTFTLTRPDISLPGILLKKMAQLTVGKWLQGTRIGNHPLIRPRRYYVNYHSLSRGVMRPFIEKILLSPEAAASGLFDTKALKHALIEHMEGRIDITAFLGQALGFILWSRMFFFPSTFIRPEIRG